MSSLKQKINFGEVPVGEKSTKQLVISKSSQSLEGYRINPRYAHYNLDKVFSFEVLIVNDELCANVIFEPKLCDYTYVDYYMIESLYDDTQKLIVKGKGLGPLVRFNRNTIKFRVLSIEEDYPNTVSSEREDAFDIINKSKVDGFYQWFIPKNGCEFFKLNMNNYGVIKGNEKITVLVTFVATVLGTFQEELVFLVLNQEPIIISLTGTFFDLNTPEDPSPRSEAEINTSYGHFMNNSLNMLSEIPMASVVPRHLDFKTGSVTDILLNISQKLCVTNHQRVEGRFHWITDAENVFIVEPVNAIIPPNDSCVFTVRFRPKENDRAYGDVICGSFTFTSGSEVQYSTVGQWFRIPCSGHTYHRMFDQLPDFYIETKIVMPPTIPGLNAYRNTSLWNNSSQQIYFSFHAPENGQFTVLPLCGMIPAYSKQIISIAFEPQRAGFYCEDWDLVVNNNCKVRISFEASAQESRVDISSSGIHLDAHAMQTFEPTTTGCASHCYSVIHNTTRNVLEIRFETTASWLTSEGGSSITLQPNEVVPHRWWFYPKKHSKVYETFVNVACVTEINGMPVGKIVEYVVFFSGYAEYPKFTINPKTLNLQEIIIGDQSKFNMLLYNYGTCVLQLRLNYEVSGYGDDHSVDIIDLPTDVFEIKPYEAKCVVGGTVICHSIGWRQIDITFSIMYETETEERCFKHFHDRVVGKIWYDGVYPTFQVKRVVCKNSPVIMSAHCIWDIMNIDSLNKSLKKCQPGVVETIDIYTPKMSAESADVKVIWLLDCITNCNLSWKAKREKLCDCELVEIQIGTSLYEKRYDCIHRKLLRLEPVAGEIKPEEAMELRITICHHLEGVNEMAYILYLPNDRSVKLLFHLETFPKTVGNLISLRRFVDLECNNIALLDCGRVPINNLDKVYRVLWFYNPSDTEVTWRLMSSTRNYPEIIDCLLYHAVIPAKSRFSLPFSFLPTEMIDYEDVFLCLVESKLNGIIVKGQGGLPSSLETRLDIPKYIPHRIANEHRVNQIYLSRDHIFLPPMPTNTIVTEQFHIINDTQNQMKFTWLTEKVGNMTRINVAPIVGYLDPNKKCVCILTVRLLQDPAVFTISVACEVTDVTARVAYENDQIWKELKTELCEQEFIITEQGISHPGLNDEPPYVLNLPQPKPFFLAFSLSLCSVGPRDSYHRFFLKNLIHQNEKSDLADFANVKVMKYSHCQKRNLRNIISSYDVLRVIEGVLWDCLNGKLMKHLMKEYDNEQVQTYNPALLEVPKVRQLILTAQEEIGEVQGESSQEHIEQPVDERSEEEKIEAKMIAWSACNWLLSKALHQIFAPKDECLFDCFCYVPNYK